MAASACSSAAGNQAYTITTGAYRDGAGWSLAYPRTWHIVHFHVTDGKARAVGIQLSNVLLPRPQLLPSIPVQVSGEVLPGHGIGLVIAQDSDRRLQRADIARPPLQYPDGWLTGSSIGGAPYFRELWFRVRGVVLLATVKVAPDATHHDLALLARIVRSIRILSGPSD